MTTESSGKKGAAGALLIGAACFFLLAGYEFIRTPTNTLFKADYGKESLPLVMACIPPFVALIVYGYARILSWFGPRKTMLITSIGSCFAISGGQLLHDAGFKEVIIFLYLFRSAYVVLLINQCWSFLNSTLDDEQARKWFGPICGIASIGAVLAGVFGSQVVEGLGTSSMIQLAALVTLPAALFADRAFALCGEPAPKIQEIRTKGHLALDLFKSEKILVVVLALVITTQIMAAVLALVFQGQLQDYMPDPDQQSAFSFSFYSWINASAALLQFVVAPLLLTFVSLAWVHITIPLIHMATCIIFIGSPSLTTAAIAYMTFKVLDYSLFLAAKELLYVPLPFDARYRAKEVIDVFGYRFSKGATAGVIAATQKVGAAFSEISYAIVALVSASTWVILVLPLAKRFKKPDV